MGFAFGVNKLDCFVMKTFLVTSTHVGGSEKLSKTHRVIQTVTHKKATQHLFVDGSLFGCILYNKLIITEGKVNELE